MDAALSCQQFCCNCGTLPGCELEMCASLVLRAPVETSSAGPQDIQNNASGRVPAVWAAGRDTRSMPNLRRLLLLH